MRKSRKNAPDPLLVRGRFAGLTQAQIRALLETDELATHAASSPTCIKEVAERYRANNLDFDSSTAIFYARAAEQNKHFGSARAWYEYAVEHHGDKKPLSEFRKRVHNPDETAKPADLRRAANHHLAWARGDFDDHLQGAIELYARLNDRRGIEATLRKAIAILDSKAVALACSKLGRALTRREHIAYARALVKDDRPGDAVAYAQKNDITEDMGHAVIERALADVQSLVNIQSWASRLGFVLSDRDLERFIQKWQQSDNVGRAVEIVGAAEELARRGSFRWERRLPALYRAARNEALGFHEIAAADRYAKKCNEPLTVSECMAVARQLEHEARDGLDWAIQAHNLALARASSLLHTQAPQSPAIARKPATATRRAA